LGEIVAVATAANISRRSGEAFKAFRRKKRKWVHEINLERKDFAEFHTLMPELRQDEKRFYIYFRMPSECFDEILILIKEDITKMDTKINLL
jgi:hypothetical protein